MLRIEVEEMRLMRAAELFLASLLEGLRPALVFEDWLDGPAAVDAGSRDGWEEAVAVSRSVFGEPLSPCGVVVPIVVDRADLHDLSGYPEDVVPFIEELVRETARRLVIMLDAGGEPAFGPAWSVCACALFLLLGDREAASASLETLLCRGYFDGRTGGLVALGTDAVRWSAAMEEAFEDLADAFPESTSCKLPRFLGRIRPIVAQAKARMIEE
jgi:hypothetical protein